MTTGGSELLERDAELQAIAAFARRTTDAARGVLLVEGPPGVGKTTLLKELERTARQAGTRVLKATAADIEADIPFALVRQLFEPIAISQPERFDGKDPVAATRDLFESNSARAISVGQYAYMHGLYWLTADICAEEPILLLIDDFHNSDVSSARFLVHLVARLADLQCQVAIGTRLAAPPEIDVLIRRLRDDLGSTVLQPQPLTEAACQELVRHSGAVASDAELAALCHQLTGGNPYLVRRLLRFVDSAPEARTDPRTLLQAAAFDVARDLNLYGLGSVPDSVRSVAEMLAIVERASLVDIADATNLDPYDVVSAIDRLTSMGLLRSRGELTFEHDLVRQAVAQHVPTDVAQRIRLQLAERLDDRGAQPEAVAALALACPPGSLVDSPKVLAALIRAVRHALARGAPEAAVRYWERYVAEAGVPAAELDVVTAMPAAYIQTDLTRAEDSIRTALALTDDAAQRILLMDQLAVALFYSGRTSDAMRICIEARELASSTASPDAWVRVHGDLGIAMFFDPSSTQARLALADELRQREFLEPSPSSCVAQALLACEALHLAGDRAEAVWRAEAALSDDVLLRDLNGGPAWFAACFALVMSDTQRSLPFIELALDDAHARGSILGVAAASYARSLARTFLGDLGGAARDLRAVQDAAATIGLDIMHPGIGHMSVCLTEQGALDAAERTLARCWPLDQSPPEVGSWYLYLYGLGTLRLAQGRSDEAAAAFRECGARYREMGGNNPMLMPWRSYLALCNPGEHASLDLVREELADADQWGDPTAIGRAHRVLGMLDGTDAATDHFEDSLAALEPSSARLECAKTHFEFGRSLRTSHPDQAVIHLSQAMDIASACEADVLVQQITAALRAMGRRPRRSATTGPKSLTNTERTVIARVLEGQTNRQVAQELYVSLKTVETHLTSAYRKLAVTSRRELLSQVDAGSLCSTPG